MNDGNFSYAWKSNKEDSFGRKEMEQNLTSELSIIKYKT